jgi:hypothetical protein
VKQVLVHGLNSISSNSPCEVGLAHHFEDLKLFPNTTPPLQTNKVSPLQESFNSYCIVAQIKIPKCRSVLSSIYSKGVCFIKAMGVECNMHALKSAVPTVVFRATRDHCRYFGHLSRE